jgi:methyl-accepting chemotaxis protein/hemerythrin
MLAQGYPGYQEQHSEHHDFAARMIELRSSYATGEPVITMELMKTLKTWLVNHIQGRDRALGAYLAAKS